MDIVIKSYNSHALNSGNYKTSIATNSPLYGNATSNDIERAGTWPTRGAKQYRGNVMILEVNIKSGTIADGIDQIGEWFNEEDSSAYSLIIQDVNDGNREWYTEAEALGIIKHDGSVVTVAVHIPDPIWRISTISTNTWNITASDQTRNLAVIGNRNARPIFTITPTSSRTGGYGYMRYVAIANRTTRIYKDAINLPDSDWDTTPLTTAKLQADGDDLRVFNDETGTEEFRWFGGGGIDTATTRVFSNVVLSPKIELTLSGSISAVGAVSTITVKNTKANKTALQALKSVPYKFVAIDMGTGTFEIFKFTDTNVNGLQITGCTRAQKSTTTNQAHSDGATIRHIHGYYVMYGNSSASAPSTDDAFKPIIDMANSTNTSHVYASFYDALNPNRTCMFNPQIVKNTGGESRLYTATQDTLADVATVIGQAIKTYKVGSSTRSPTADLIWSLFHPAGITTLTWSGSKYRYGNSWPAIATMQKSNDGKTWSNVAAIEARPSAVQTWESLASHSSVSLVSTYLNIRFRFQGTVAATISNWAAHEISDLTAVLDSNNVPLINFGAEQTNNYLEFRITNNNTGQWLEVSAPVPLNTTLEIDTDNLTVTLSDGTSVPVHLDDESRADWLPLLPNQTNVIKYTESGVNAVTIVTTWRDRNL